MCVWSDRRKQQVKHLEIFVFWLLIAIIILLTFLQKHIQWSIVSSNYIDCRSLFIGDFGISRAIVNFQLMTNDGVFFFLNEIRERRNSKQKWRLNFFNGQNKWQNISANKLVTNSNNDNKKKLFNRKKNWAIAHKVLCVDKLR